MEKSAKEWYSVKCVFVFDRLAYEEAATVYEERVLSTNVRSTR